MSRSPAADPVPELPLPQGMMIPQVGLGTWEMRGRECEEAVRTALELGYRHVDTAEGYDNQAAVGRGMRGHDREELFLTSKVWRAHLTPDGVRRVCEESLRELDTAYLDLLLIHWPNRSIPVGETVEGFESLREEGKIRSWGVSNFTEAHLREVVRHGRPATNQVELHPYFRQDELSAVCRELDIPITAYSPLAKGRVSSDPVILEIAQAHDATPARVALRWALQHGYIVIPKSSTEEHLRENLDLFGFELTDEEMSRLDHRPQGERIVDGSWSEFDR